MREYSVVTPGFWNGGTGRRIRAAGVAARVAAMYLLTGSQANALGLYYMPLAFMAHETGLGEAETTRAMAVLQDLGFCRYDADSECVWVPEMARFQVAGRLKPADHRVRFVNDLYARLPDNPFLGPFFDRYAADLCLAGRRDGAGDGAPEAADGAVRTVGEGACQGGAAALSGGLPSQEQEQDQEQERGVCVARAGLRGRGADERERAFVRLWSAYPVQRGQARAREAWRLAWSATPDLPEIDELVRIVGAFAARDWEWRRGKVPRLWRFIAEGLWREAPRESPPGAEEEGGERRALAAELLRELDHGQ